MGRRRRKKTSGRTGEVGLRFTRPHRHAGVEYVAGDVLTVPAEQAESLLGRLPVEPVVPPMSGEAPAEEG